MKRNDELLTQATEIKDETSSGANTASRVGGHLAAMVNRLDKCDIRQPDATAGYKALQPTICFKFDYVFENWASMIHASTGSMKAVYGADVPCTFFVPAERIHRGVIKSIMPSVETPLVFTPAVYDGNAALVSEATIAGAGFIDAQIAETNFISFSDTTHNSAVHYRVKSVNEAGTEITVFTTAYMDDKGNEIIKGNVTSETLTSGTIAIHRGDLNHPSYADLKLWIDAGHKIGAYNRTGRPNTAYRGYAMPTDAEMWEEIYGAKRDMDAGFAAAGSDFEVEMLIPPGGTNNYRSQRMARQAGYKCVDGQGYEQTNNVFNPSIINPWQFEELNSNIACNTAKSGTVSCTEAGTTLTGSGTNFNVDFSVGDPIVFGEAGKWQLRFIAAFDGDNPATVLTVTEAFDVAISNKSHYHPVGETIKENVIYSAQSVIGHINHIIKAGSGMFIIAGHDGFVTAADLRKDIRGVALQYIKYVQGLTGASLTAFKTALGMDADIDADAEIILTDMSSAYDAYAPIIEAGIHFSVNDDGVRIGRARSTSFTIDTDSDQNYGSVRIGYAAGRSNNGLRNTYIGRWAGYGALGDEAVATGSQAGNGNTKGNTVLLGAWAGYINTGINTIALGSYAGHTNSGNFCVLIGYKAGKGNTEHSLFEVSYNEGSPLIKGYFNTGAIILGAPAAAVADAKIDANRFSFFLDEVSNKLKVKVCYANGTTYKLGEVALSDPA